MVGQLEEVLARHGKVLSEEPGLTNLAVLTINTGDTQPIAQYPYRPPDRMLGKIEEEIGELKEKRIIEPFREPVGIPCHTSSKAE